METPVFVALPEGVATCCDAVSCGKWVPGGARVALFDPGVETHGSLTFRVFCLRCAAERFERATRTA